MFGILNRPLTAVGTPVCFIHYTNGIPESTETFHLSAEELKESAGKAETDIEPGKFGRIRHGGTSWKARSGSHLPIYAHDDIRVLKREGLTLWVVRA